jgi:preprotein translocase subunit YajC
MPQKKERKKRDQMINELKIGNKIITLSGIYGEITKVEDDFIMVKIGENTKVKMTRSAVSTVVMEKKEDKK